MSENNSTFDPFSGKDVVTYDGSHLPKEEKHLEGKLVTDKDLEQKTEDIETRTGTTKEYISELVGDEIANNLYSIMDSLASGQDLKINFNELTKTLKGVNKSEEVEDLIILNYVLTNEGGLENYITNTDLSKHSRNFFEGTINMLKKGMEFEEVKNYLDFGVSYASKPQKKDAERVKFLITTEYSVESKTGTIWGKVEKAINSAHAELYNGAVWLLKTFK